MVADQEQRDRVKKELLDWLSDHNVSVAGDRAKWYRGTKTINVMTMAQTQLAVFHHNGDPRQLNAVQVELPMMSSERSIGSLLYTSSVCAKSAIGRKVDELYAVELIKDELPRRLNGSTGVRSLLDALATAMMLQRIGATLFAPSIKQVASDLVEGTVLLLPHCCLNATWLILA